MPPTNPFRSGTWAITLLAMMTSAGPCSARIRRATSRSKNSSSVGTPAAMAALAWVGAGSTPSTGTPASTKLRKRYPSLLASSTTSDEGPSRRDSMSPRAWSALCARRWSLNEEKYR